MVLEWSLGMEWERHQQRQKGTVREGSWDKVEQME